MGVDTAMTMEIDLSGALGRIANAFKGKLHSRSVACCKWQARTPRRAAGSARRPTAQSRVRSAHSSAFHHGRALALPPQASHSQEISQ
jgi:hypothetical protein